MRQRRSGALDRCRTQPLGRRGGRDRGVLVVLAHGARGPALRRAARGGLRAAVQRGRDAGGRLGGDGRRPPSGAAGPDGGPAGVHRRSRRLDRGEHRRRAPATRRPAGRRVAGPGAVAGGGNARPTRPPHRHHPARGNIRADGGHPSPARCRPPRGGHPDARHRPAAVYQVGDAVPTPGNPRHHDRRGPTPEHEHITAGTATPARRADPTARRSNPDRRAAPDPHRAGRPRRHLPPAAAAGPRHPGAEHATGRETAAHRPAPERGHAGRPTDRQHAQRAAAAVRRSAGPAAHVFQEPVVNGGIRQRLPAVCWTLLLGIGLPAGLLHFAGSPLPRHRPSRENLLRWLDQPLTRGSLTIALTYLLWLVWALFIAVVLAEALAHLTRVRLPRPRLPYPLHSVVGGLFGAAVVTVSTAPMPAHAAADQAAAADPPAAPDQSVPSATAHPHHDRTGTGTGTGPSRPQWTGTGAGSHQPMGPPSTDPTLVTRRVHEKAVAGVTAPSESGAASMMVLAGYRQPKTDTDTGRYLVRRGDTLSAIARRHLGNANRWPEICALNWHRHWPAVGGTLRDCDLIYPGWDLKLPADANPPKGAAPAPPPPPPPAQPEPNPDPGQSRPPTPAPSASAAVPSALPAPTTAPTPATSPSAASASAPASPGTTTPTEADDDTTPSPSADDHGVHLPGGSFVPWALAAAITAAAAMVWLHRRRRFVPGGDGEDDDPLELPPPVVELHRHVARNPEVSMPSHLAERAAAVPAQPLLPPGGVGLVGDGAHAAARAALISTLASGGPRDPDRRGEVVIDGTTLTTLFGADAAALGPWPRLHVADDLDHALSILDARLLHRARVLDEHSLTDLDSLRERAPRTRKPCRRCCSSARRLHPVRGCAPGSASAWAPAWTWPPCCSAHGSTAAPSRWPPTAAPAWSTGRRSRRSATGSPCWTPPRRWRSWLPCARRTPGNGPPSCFVRPYRHGPPNRDPRPAPTTIGTAANRPSRSPGNRPAPPPVNSGPRCSSVRSARRRWRTAGCRDGRCAARPPSWPCTWPATPTAPTPPPSPNICFRRRRCVPPSSRCTPTPPTCAMSSAAPADPCPAGTCSNAARRCGTA